MVEKITSMNEIRASRISELFNIGNYSTVAMMGNPDHWETYAALGLIGKTEEAISGLKRFDHPEAKYYSAVASWIGGDDKVAIKGLEKIPTRHANNLLALIIKPKIKILTQLSFVRQPPHELVIAVTRDNRFDIRNIGFHPLDLANQAYADVRNFYDSHDPPDFYFCQMVEWHFLPHNLQQLPCPILAQTSDYDAYIHAVYPWLQLFDELVVTDGTEWEDVHRIVDIPVSTFPKTFGIPISIPSVPKGSRDIDVFISGSVFHPFFPEKAILLHQILKIPNINVKVINGFVSIEDYLSLLGSSKICFTYYRRPGGTVTRALDALSMGCSVIVQKGSILNLFLGEESGLLNYDFDANNLADAIQKIINSWDQFKLRALKGSEIIRREFSLSKVASQYLRFLTFLAAKPRRQRKIVPLDQLDQKRFTLSKGCLPCSPPVAEKMQEMNIVRWRDRWQRDKSPRIIIDLTRQMILEYTKCAMAHPNKLSKSDDPLLLQSIELYRAGVAYFPRSLVLDFNLIRTIFHFGSPKEVSFALKLSEEVFSKPESSWHVDDMEDIFPWDFYSQFFNYRMYFHYINEHLKHGIPISLKLARLILASLHYYVSYYDLNFDHLEKAIELDPDFPFYKLRYVEELMKLGRSEDGEKIYSLLIRLAERSILFLEAYDLLKKLSSKTEFGNQKLEEWIKLLERAKSSITFFEKLESQPLRPIYHSSSQNDLLPMNDDVVSCGDQKTQTPEIISLILSDLSWQKKYHAIDGLRFKLSYILEPLKKNKWVRGLLKR